MSLLICQYLFLYNYLCFLLFSILVICFLDCIIDVGCYVLVLVPLDYCCVNLFWLNMTIWVCNYIGLYDCGSSLFISLLFVIFVDISFFISSLWFYNIPLIINYCLILCSNLIVSIITIDLLSFEDNSVMICIFLIYFHIHLVNNDFTLRIYQGLFLNYWCFVYFLFITVILLLSILFVLDLLDHICLFYILIVSRILFY